MCDGLGFKFKEQAIWNKINISSPFGNLPRQHENISIRVKGKKSLNKQLVDYIDDKLKMEAYSQIANTMKRINSLLNNNVELAERFLRYGEIIKGEKHKSKFCVTTSSKMFNIDRGVKSLKTFTEGGVLSTLITESRDSLYNSIHPTQKPVKLFEKLINLCSNEGDLILDPFSGSGSSAIACINTNRNFLGYEIDEEYYSKSLDRIKGD